MESTKRSKMTWHAGHGKHIYSEKGHYSARLLDGTRIEVHPDMYHKAFNAHLILKGIRPTTWSEIMGKAEREWQAYCQFMDAFAENIQQWFTYHNPGVFIDLPSGQELPTVRVAPNTHVLLQKEREKLSTASRKMTWHAGRGRHCSSYWGYHSVCLEDGARIEVSSETYDQRFNAYLNDLGIQRTTWSQIMGKADAEWRAYCQLMDTFAENTQQWLTSRGEGIFVMHPALEE
jgi:hypothetical protein